MKKIFLVLVCVLATLGIFSGCSKNSENSEEKSVDMEELRKSMTEDEKFLLPDLLTVSDKDDVGGNLFTYLSAVDYSKVDEYFYSYSSEGLADEIAVVKVKSKEDVTLMKESLQEHMNSRIKLFKNYDESQVETAENAIIVTHDKYVALIVSKQNGSIKEAFDKVFP